MNQQWHGLLGVFVAMFAGCAFDEPDGDADAVFDAAIDEVIDAAIDEMPGTLGDEVTGEAVGAVFTPGALTRELGIAMRDGRITSAEWTSRLQPLAQELPRTASADADELVKLWADRPSAIAATAFEAMRTILHACGYGVPRVASEPMLPSQVLIADNLTTPDADFEAVAAAAGVPTGATVTVAVLDDGILFTHPALAGHRVTAPGALTQFDFVDNDASLPATDHGTATSSLASRGTQRVKILPLRVAINSGIPSTLAFGQVVSSAIDAAVEQGVRVISISYVTNRPADITLIRAAMARHPDTLFVLAAGNGNSQLGTAGLGPDQFLATMHTDNVMIVSNATRAGARFAESFGGSNFGTPWADVAMRGMEFPVAIASGSYGRSRGTSSATPNVAAVAARVRLIDPSLSAAQVKTLLVDTAQRLPAWTGLVNAGGLVDQARAIRAAAAGL